MSKLIPFRLLPASWGLNGKPYEEAKAYYELDGEALERRVAEINLGHDPALLEDRHLEIDLAHGIVTAFDFNTRRNDLALLRGEIDQMAHDIQTIRIEHDTAIGADPYQRDRKIAERQHPEPGVEQSLALFDVDLAHGRISRQKHAKERATLLEEPWVDTVESGFDPKEGVNGFSLTLDWNSYWVEYLRLHGYTGLSESDIVEKWFADVCRSKEPVQDPTEGMLIPFRGPFSSENGTFVV